MDFHHQVIVHAGRTIKKSQRYVGFKNDYVITLKYYSNELSKLPTPTDTMNNPHPKALTDENDPSTTNANAPSTATVIANFFNIITSPFSLFKFVVFQLMI